MPEPAPVTTATFPANPCMRALPSVGCVERSRNQGDDTALRYADVAHIHTSRERDTQLPPTFPTRCCLSWARGSSTRRALTPDDQKALSKTVRTYPKNKRLRPESALTSLGIGEAVVTVLSEKEAPTPFLGIWRSRALCVRRYRVRPRITGSMFDTGRRRRYPFTRRLASCKFCPRSAPRSRGARTG